MDLVSRWIGAHFSIAGGIAQAPRTAAQYACGTLQLFTKNASQWAAKPLTSEAIADFQQAVRQANAHTLTAHDSYLINLAAPGEELFEKSIRAFIVELERAEALGLTYLVTHPGAHVGQGEDAGLARAVAGLDRVTRATAGGTVQILLETTAGQGTTLGYKIEHLATLLQQIAQPERFGLCVDTCHLFAAGYDLRTPEGYEATLAQFERLVGLEKIRVWHVNDSLKPLGSRVDRHAGLGEGQIGPVAFQCLMQDARFATIPKILETPKTNAAGEPQDPVNLAKLRSWARRKATKKGADE